MNNASQDKKIYGTSLFIGSLQLETKMGNFYAYTYQNLIHKGYIIALVKGNLSSDEIYIRVHSSCVTSETLRSLDCDCVLQLEGALKIISEKENGILFYLIQEGRGCGYIGKSRACMLVQYNEDKISTFDAYDELGMKADYRDYSNIKEVMHMLGIEKESFVLMTNNPDKIKGLQDCNINIKRIQSIEVKPSSFNQSYLISKEKMGHLLYQTKTKVSKYKLPYSKIKPFEPFPLKKYSRFICCSSYYIPIKPVNNQMIFNEDELMVLKEKKVYFEVTHEYENMSKLLLFNDMDLDGVGIKPYWFKVTMYYDLASHSDYIVLSYGDIHSKTPMVRIHSESLFNRFPLKEKKYRDKYISSVEAIVKNGTGIIILLYHDGRGSGLGNYVLNSMKNSEYTGIKIDNRDFDAVSMLLKYHLKGQSAKILFSGGSRSSLQNAFDKEKVKVLEWVDQKPKNLVKGHHLLSQRIEDAPGFLFHTKCKKFNFTNNIKYYVTGVGSSEAHARYFCYLAHKYYSHENVIYIPLLDVKKDNEAHLVLFSQGLSPNVHIALENKNYKNISLFTSVSENNNNFEKKQIIHELEKNGCNIFRYPLEDEYTTLLRVIGPLCGYYAIYQTLLPKSASSNSEEKILFKTLKNSQKKQPDKFFLRNLSVNPFVTILISSSQSGLFNNLQNKLEEGSFLASIRIIDYIEFAHGPFQNIEYQYEKGIINNLICIVSSNLDEELFQKTQDMLSHKYPVWRINSNLDSNLQILELEMIFNYFVLNWVEKMEIDQISWCGKEKQKEIYELSSLKDLNIANKTH